MALLEPGQTSTMELFVKIINGMKLLAIFTESSISGIWMGSKYTSAFRKYWISKRFCNFFAYSIVISEAATGGVLWEKVLLEISRNSQPVPDRLATLLKKGIWQRCFSSEFCEISKNTFLTEHLWMTTFIISSLVIQKQAWGLRLQLY